jgi:5-methylcytosine-specific restriction endonuclease McrA
MTRKKCRKCGRRRVLHAFAKNKGMQDGRINTCKTCHSAYTKEHYSKNKAVYIAKSAHWQSLNPEKKRASSAATARRYRQQHPEESRARFRKYKKANPQKFAEHENRRRARKLNAVVEKIDREVIYRRDNGTCHICGKRVTFKTMELDHVIPLARGGNHTEDNLKTAHPTCNRRKWAHIV